MTKTSNDLIKRKQHERHNLNSYDTKISLNKQIAFNVHIKNTQSREREN